MSHVHLKRMYILPLWGKNTLKILIKSIWSNVLFKATVSLLIFCLGDLAINVNGVWKCPTMTALLLTFPFMSINICPLIFFLKILFIYFYTEEKGGRKRGRETSVCGCLWHAPYWGPVRHVC
ncbi:hypothetical protein HJG60_007930 [Phyllostomus discolor]|uniref:Uncharacterized protein n=1 Tax=Phyllostomus discolor TaxID=89673 RepID=A0A834BE47_9CHIR|nr:hypothetical protein HJG60_007930 [Phyllostomus discolor]